MMVGLRRFGMAFILPLFCAVLVLGGMAQLRAQAGKIEQAGIAAHVALCLQSQQDGSDLPQQDHDCDECRLTPAPAMVGVAPVALPCVIPTIIKQSPGITAHAGALRISLPWSTGPPLKG
jgi:hypothetical protein